MVLKHYTEKENESNMDNNQWITLAPTFATALCVPIAILAMRHDSNLNRISRTQSYLRDRSKEYIQLFTKLFNNDNKYKNIDYKDIDSTLLNQTDRLLNIKLNLTKEYIDLGIGHLKSQLPFAKYLSALLICCYHFLTIILTHEEPDKIFNQRERIFKEMMSKLGALPAYEDAIKTQKEGHKIDKRDIKKYEDINIEDINNAHIILLQYKPIITNTPRLKEKIRKLKIQITTYLFLYYYLVAQKNSK